MKKVNADDPSTQSRNGVSLLVRLESALDYPNALSRAAQYILEYPQNVVHQPLAETSEASKAGQATIFRLCRELGFKGFTDFKLALAAELARRPQNSTDSYDAADDNPDHLEVAISKALSSTRQLMSAIDVTEIAQLLVETRQIVLYGSGTSATAAQAFSFHMLGLGVNAHNVPNANIAAECALALREGAVAIAISQSGVSPDTVQFLKSAKGSGARTIAITAHPKASISKYADVIIQMSRIHHIGRSGSSVGLIQAVYVAEILSTAVASLPHKSR
ncbi:hypothetical protein CPY51_15835 [Rhizobium tubonense]|uniref:RpiR family transcriptional regulator n=2 Tax=Rhizobium tubonense TaxID=484088 RepID=A0A2W4EP67_9HYPH|nr:hypothetical protein CPY51_15835 [Rhizobium tubonense]